MFGGSSVACLFEDFWMWHVNLKISETVAKQLRRPAHRSNFWKGAHTQIISAPHNEVILWHAPLLLCHKCHKWLVSSCSCSSWCVLVWACKTICIWSTTAAAATIRPMRWGATRFEASTDQMISDLLSGSATLQWSMLKLALKKLWRQFGRTQGELKTSLQVEGMASLWELLGGSGKDNVLYIDALPCCKHALQDGMNMRKPRCDAWFPRSFFIVLI